MHQRGCIQSDNEDADEKCAKLFVCTEEDCQHKPVHFITKQAMKAHKERKHGGQDYSCTYCGKVYKAKGDCHEHQLVCSKNADKLEPVECTFKGCTSVFQAPKYLRRHMKEKHGWGKSSK